MLYGEIRRCAPAIPNRLSQWHSRSAETCWQRPSCRRGILRFIFFLLLYIFRGSPRLVYGKSKDCYMKKRNADDIQSAAHKAPMASRRHSPVNLPGSIIYGTEHSLLSPLGRVTSRALLVGVFCEFCILLYPILFHFSIHSTHLVSSHFSLLRLWSIPLLGDGLSAARSAAPP